MKFRSLLILLLFLTFCQSGLKAQTNNEYKNMKDTPKYGLHGKLVAKQGTGEDLVEILLEAARLMQTAKGCHLYAVGIDPENADEIWVTEIWDNKEAHDNSLQLPGVKELIGKAIPILDGSPTKGQEWHILGGTGIN